MVTCPECVEEGVTRVRPPAPGGTKGRCATHWRAVKKARKRNNREVYVQRVYNLSPERQRRILEAQGNLCAICLRPSHIRALAWDHDHACCPGSESCGKCVRGALCRTCNHDLLGHYSAETLARAALYLINPPAKNFP